MNARELFLNDLNNSRLCHAYMISGTDAAAVREFLSFAASSIVCTGGNPPCGLCLDCVKARNNTHTDIIKIPTEGKKIVVDDIGRIIEDSYIRPLESPYKVYCLYNFDEANEKAQNKLLKTLEEPVKNTIFLIGALNSQHILPTVKSRVKKLVIEDNLAFFLKAASTAEFAAISDSIAQMYTSMRSSAQILDYVLVFSRLKDLSQLLNLFELYTRDIILFKTGADNLLLYKAKKDDIMIAARDFSLAALSNIIKNISAARKNIGFNVNTIPMLDNLLYSILEEKHRCP